MRVPYILPLDHPVASTAGSVKTRMLCTSIYIYIYSDCTGKQCFWTPAHVSMYDCYRIHQHVSMSACGHFPLACACVSRTCTCTDVHYISRVTYIFHFSIEKHYSMIPTASCLLRALLVPRRPGRLLCVYTVTAPESNAIHHASLLDASAWSLVLQCIYACSMTATLSTSSAYRHSLPGRR